MGFDPLDRGRASVLWCLFVPVLSVFVWTCGSVADAVELAGRELSDADIRRVEAGDILTRWEDPPGPGLNRKVASAGILPASARDAWALATDFRNYPLIYTGIASARLVVEQPREAVGTYVLSLPWPLPERWVTTRAWLDPDRRYCSWRKEGGTVRTYEGHLQVLPWGGRRSMLLYAARIDPDLSFLPSWFWDWAQERALPSVVAGLRDTLEKPHGPYWRSGVQRPRFEFAGRRLDP
ncbi:MAG: SRPBCC family protein [Candidatus Sericytochromatia bacterium]|nr:SRPBCC family protein [Candidatus Sericytochromatia bacterium]